MDENMDMSLVKIVEVIGPQEVFEFWQKLKRKEGEDMGEYLERTSPLQKPGESDADYVERMRLTEMQNHVTCEKSELMIRGDDEEVSDYHERMAGLCKAMGVCAPKAAVLTSVAANSYESDDIDFPEWAVTSVETALGTRRSVELTAVVNDICQQAFMTIFTTRGLQPRGDVYSGERGTAVRLTSFAPKALKNLDVVQDPEKYQNCKMELFSDSTAVLYVLEDQGNPEEI
jgi:hypothetical protein